MPRKLTDTEFSFKIDAYTPATMPLVRLAQYMTELAVLLGEERAVHFHRLETGSTVIVNRIAPDATNKVRERAALVRRRQGPIDAKLAFQRINKLLREDNATGSLIEKKNIVLQFPGETEVEEKLPPIRQQGSIEGVIVSVGGKDNVVNVRLLCEGSILSGINTSNRSLGKELASHFDEHVRLNGVGTWQRESDGRWNMLGFRIDSFEPLREISLSEALLELRGLPLELAETAYLDLETIRNGQRGSNGRN